MKSNGYWTSLFFKKWSPIPIGLHFCFRDQKVKSGFWPILFQGGSKFHSVQWSLNSWPFAGKSGTGQCTHCRGGAESVLTLSPTVKGVVLHLLGANLTRRKDKYTSASPRCTCLPSRQICIGVALGDPPQTPLQCWLVGRTSPAWGMQLGLQWRVFKYTYGAAYVGCYWSTNYKYNSGGWCTWLTPLQCWLGGRQVHLGYASVYLPPSSSTLRWSCTRCLYHRLLCNVDSEESKYTSATPRCTCLLYTSPSPRD